MSSAVYSVQWHRVAARRPRLRAGVRVQRQRARGETWFVLADPDSGHSVRLNRTAYELAGRLDGTHSVDQVWQQAQARAQDRQLDDAPTQPDVEQVLARLQQAGLLAWPGEDQAEGPPPGLPGPMPPTAGRSLLNWRMPLLDPAGLLDRAAPLGRRVFSAGGAGVFLAGLLLLVALGLAHAQALSDHAARWLGTPWMGLLSLLLYLPIKAVHELAHGLAVRRWGGRVREAGVSWVLGVPMPYVDAAAATAFGPRHARLAVSAAGIAAELLIGLLALIAWCALDEGRARDVALAAFMASALSTLLFNANPLQRLDGYHLLCDALELPNLASRSRAWWQAQMRRHLLGQRDVNDTDPAPGERLWLMVYAPASALWMLGVLVGLVRWVATASAAAGAAVAALAVLVGVLRPLVRAWRGLHQAAAVQSSSMRRARLAAVVLGLGTLALLGLPWPRHLVAEGVVMPGERAQLRAGQAGVVVQVLRHHDERVAAGDAVLVMSDAESEARAHQARERLEAVESEWTRAQGTDGSTDLGSLQARRQMAQAELETEAARAELRVLRAASAGRLVLPTEADLPGRWLREGEDVGRVLSGEAPVLRVAVPADQAEALRRAETGPLAGRSASVRLAAEPGHFHAAQVLREEGGAGWVLPGAALAERHGGSWLTEPVSERQTDPLRPREPLVWVDLALSSQDLGASAENLGARGWARFTLDRAPLAQRAWEAVARAWSREARPGT